MRGQKHDLVTKLVSGFAPKLDKVAPQEIIYSWIIDRIDAVHPKKVIDVMHLGQSNEL